MKKGFKLIVLSVLLGLSFQLFSQEEAESTTDGRFGTDSVSCVTNFSLFREFYKQRNFKDAYEPWQKAFEICPQMSKNIYINGAVLLDYQIRSTKLMSRREQLVDTLMMVYDARIEYFGEEAFVLGRKSIDYIRYVPEFYVARARQAEKEGNQERIAELNDSIIMIWNKAYEMLDRAVNLAGNTTSAPVIDGFFQTAELYYQNNDADKEVIVEAYDKAGDILDFNIKDYTNKINVSLNQIEMLNEQLADGMIEKANYDQTMQKIAKDTALFNRTLDGYNTVKNNIETRFSPYATCEDLVNIYEKKLKGNEENVEVLTKITRMLNRKKCTDSEIFFVATENLHKLQPTAYSAFLMGYMLFKKEDFSGAKNYLEEAIDKYEDNSDKAGAYLLLIEACSKLRQYNVARQHAYKYAEIDPSSGMPYLLIGDMYMASAASCGDDELTTRVANWAAYDKYARARSIDKSLEDDANERMGRARSRFPDNKTIFFYGLQKGQSYTVGCWINETTTVK